MSFIVQKFGGSSVANAEKLKNVADIISEAYHDRNQVVVVVSAQGDTTDMLIQKAREITPNPSKREMDVLLSTGEQISIALLAMELEKRRLPVVSLTGWQIPVKTDSEYSAAHIKKIETERIENELEKNRIVIVAGFQGINSCHDITTLGRGGSDTTAVALASALNADICQIYTDVEGVFTADPRTVKTAVKMPSISYDEMLALSAQGAQVLHDRSVELAKKYHVSLEVRSSFQNVPGTIVTEKRRQGSCDICGIAKDANVSLISLEKIPNVPGMAYKIFSMLASQKIKLDLMVQSFSPPDQISISFSTARDDMQQTADFIRTHQKQLQFESCTIDNDVTKISIVGSHMNQNIEASAAVFEALFEEGIDARLISADMFSISMLVSAKDADFAVRTVHDRIFCEKMVSKAN